MYEPFYYNDPLFEQYKDNFVFVKVGSNKLKKLKHGLQQLDLKTLPNYKELGKHYAESETLYNIFKNGKQYYENVDYVGFLQYDHVFSAYESTIQKILLVLSQNPETISFVSLPMERLFRQTCIIDNKMLYEKEMYFEPILEDYNKFENSNLKISDLMNKSICVSSAFMTKTEIFDGMMKFVNLIIESSNLDVYDREMRIPGCFLERYYGVYLLFNSNSNVKIPLHHYMVSGQNIKLPYQKLTVESSDFSN